MKHPNFNAKNLIMKYRSNYLDQKELNRVLNNELTISEYLKL